MNRYRVCLKLAQVRADNSNELRHFNREHA